MDFRADWGTVLRFLCFSYELVHESGLDGDANWSSSVPWHCCHELLLCMRTCKQACCNHCLQLLGTGTDPKQLSMVAQCAFSSHCRQNHPNVGGFNFPPTLCPPQDPTGNFQAPSPIVGRFAVHMMGCKRIWSACQLSRLIKHLGGVVASPRMPPFAQISWHESQ